ncbi:MAG TPA: hypothetical protein VFU15_02325, partial [Bacteroidia bacterium]|nr:hypothetical protein [Bacteroidia bacterium]
MAFLASILLLCVLFFLPLSQKRSLAFFFAAAGILLWLFFVSAAGFALFCEPHPLSDLQNRSSLPGLKEILAADSENIYVTTTVNSASASGDSAGNETETWLETKRIGDFKTIFSRKVGECNTLNAITSAATDGKRLVLTFSSFRQGQG